MVKRSEQFVATNCGHTTARAGDVTALGVTIQTEVPVRDGEVEYCLNCIARMAIQCAWCGLPIFIGDPVTLYSLPVDFTTPAYVVGYSLEPLRLVGCLRSDCASTVADRQGFWLPDDTGHGHVQRVPSPLEQVMASGKGVIVADISDLAEATRDSHLFEP